MKRNVKPNFRENKQCEYAHCLLFVFLSIVTSLCFFRRKHIYQSTRRSRENPSDQSEENRLGNSDLQWHGMTNNTEHNHSEWIINPMEDFYEKSEKEIFEVEERTMIDRTNDAQEICENQDPEKKVSLELSERKEEPNEALIDFQSDPNTKKSTSENATTQESITTINEVSSFSSEREGEEQKNMKKSQEKMAVVETIPKKILMSTQGAVKSSPGRTQSFSRLENNPLHSLERFPPMQPQPQRKKLSTRPFHPLMSRESTQQRRLLSLGASRGRRPTIPVPLSNVVLTPSPLSFPLPVRPMEFPFSRSLPTGAMARNGTSFVPRGSPILSQKSFPVGNVQPSPHHFVQPSSRFHALQQSKSATRFQPNFGRPPYYNLNRVSNPVKIAEPMAQQQISANFQQKYQQQKHQLQQTQSYSPQQYQPLSLQQNSQPQQYPVQQMHQYEQNQQPYQQLQQQLQQPQLQQSPSYQPQPFQHYLPSQQTQIQYEYSYSNPYPPNIIEEVSSASQSQRKRKQQSFPMENRTWSPSMSPASTIFTSSVPSSSFSNNHVGMDGISSGINSGGYQGQSYPSTDPVALAQQQYYYYYYLQQQQQQQHPPK